MKYCAECGNEIQEDERFCSNCGTPVSSDSSEDDSNEEYVEATNKEKKGAKNDALSSDEDSLKDESSPEESKQSEKESSGSSKDGCIGCLILIVIIVLIFKGCGFFFGSDDEEQIEKAGIELMQQAAEIQKSKNKYFFAKNYKVKNIKINGDRATAILHMEIGISAEKYEDVCHFQKRGDKWIVVPDP